MAYLSQLSSCPAGFLPASCAEELASTARAVRGGPGPAGKPQGDVGWRRAVRLLVHTIADNQGRANIPDRHTNKLKESARVEHGLAPAELLRPRISRLIFEVVRARLDCMSTVWAIDRRYATSLGAPHRLLMPYFSAAFDQWCHVRWCSRT